eukprot:CAMPEP_0119555242 /NCGR_PEP_ID=MMETSP1352-20130426/7519_1 /TAXON_ID=265584 /ORGANISM="Stauroneis constricta, Strain CCMP1120" /LENGTH=935 /DNA_ID=CAMNT_0007601979 /DNA_START=28 /DNA_END=2835 /DNA_ORIENTATION=-
MATQVEYSKTNQNGGEDRDGTHIKLVKDDPTTTVASATTPTTPTDDDHDGNANKDEDVTMASSSSSSRSTSTALATTVSIIGYILRIAILDIPLALLFASYVACCCVQFIGHEYLIPQINLMIFQDAGRPFTDLTYYHRTCTEKDITATQPEELYIPLDATAAEVEDRMLKHGVSIFQNILSEETASGLREFIIEQNQIQDGWYVINNQNRYSWGIDISMHPLFHQAFKEMSQNEQFITSIQKVVGPNPAIIEFTAITSTYGAKDQHDHQDVVPEANGAKFARTFIPSYSFFMPLQDTTYDMGATHVCPGSHLCSTNCNVYCADHSLPVSGYGNSTWPRGSGALVNQQTTHKGMAHKDPNGPDRVVLIATFAPRPQTHRGLETRQIGWGGSYSMTWTHWGNTLYDFIHADERMTRPQLLMRTLGLSKGGGYTWVTQASTRIANGDNGYTEEALEDFLEDDGLLFWPQSWQAEIDGPYDDGWERFAIGTVELSKQGLKKLNVMALLAYFALVAGAAYMMGHDRQHIVQTVVRYGKRSMFINGAIVLVALWLLKSVKQSNWARNIKSAKAYRLPTLQPYLDDENPATLPREDDILLTNHYASERFASFTRVVDVAHPGNRQWKELVKTYASGYGSLPTSMQVELSASIMRWGNETGRFLKPNAVRQWSEILEVDELIEASHKELTLASSAFNEAMIRQLDSLDADLVYDRWHDTAMNKRHIAKHVSSLRRKLFPTLRSMQKKTKQSGNANTVTTSTTIAGVVVASLDLFAPASFLLPINIPSTSNALNRSPSQLILGQRDTSRVPPYPAAWVEETDLVEVKYKCKFEEWYRAILVEVQCADMRMTVQYLDGEEGTVDPSCVRKFEPFRYGEQVQVRADEKPDEWIPATFVRSIDGPYGDFESETSVVQSEERGMLKVLPPNIRRMYIESDDDDDDDD